MDADMIRRCNEVVSSEDTVYVLGDLGADGYEKDILSKLKASKTKNRGCEITKVVAVPGVFDMPLVIKKLLRRGYVPYSEIDAQLLVKHSLTKVGTMCYLANFKPVNGVQGKIKIENSAELSKKLEELAQLLKEGMITKDEYNTKRAEALMNVTSKK